MYSMKGCLAAMLLSVAAIASVAAEQPPQQAKHTVPRSEAVEALRTFQNDPLHNLEAASTFTTYVKEDGAVHVSITTRLVPWMLDRTLPNRIKAILLSAFVAGNFQSQLDDPTRLDDTAASLAYTVEVYELLKQEDPALKIALLDELLAAKGEGELEVAIQNLINSKAPESAESK